jgi:hypothetical protein
MKGLISYIAGLVSSRVFSLGQIITYWVVFLAFFLLLNAVIQAVNLIKFLDTSLYWPISVFRVPVLTDERLTIALLAVLVFGLCAYYSNYIVKRIYLIIAVVFLLIVCTNFIQGTDKGFIYPMTEKGSYYVDSQTIHNPLEFLSSYESTLGGYHSHTRSHPPGPVLFMYYLRFVVRDTWNISLVIAALSTFLSILFLGKIIPLLIKGSEIAANQTCFMFGLIPSVQIYYCASLDAVIAALFLGTLYFFLRRSSLAGMLGLSLLLFLSSWLTFGVLFLPGVFLIFAIFKRWIPWNLMVAVAVCIIGWWLVYLLTGFNYVNCFFLASHMENPHGFRLIWDTGNYFVTRLENIVEPALFFGPFMIVMFVRGLKTRVVEGVSDARLLAIIGIAVLAGMFLTGAFHTGETARACLFIYPYLMLPVAEYLHGVGLSRHELIQLACLVFLQSLLMQYFGSYLW